VDFSRRVSSILEGRTPLA